ncbi:hypothetical protein D3C76_25690 [compost metagenome]
MKYLSYVAVFAVVMGLHWGYADPEGTKQVLTDEGYTDIEVKGRQYFGCDRNFYRTVFTAKNSRGIKVHGLVCKSFLDGAAYIKRT